MNIKVILKNSWDHIVLLLKIIQNWSLLPKIHYMCLHPSEMAFSSFNARLDHCRPLIWDDAFALQTVLCSHLFSVLPHIHIVRRHLKPLSISQLQVLPMLNSCPACLPLPSKLLSSKTGPGEGMICSLCQFPNCTCFQQWTLARINFTLALSACWAVPSIIAGGDNWAKKHENWHRSTLYVQLLPQTGKAQSMTPQTTKYRYRTVI